MADPTALFSTAEARAFKNSALADTTNYPTADITAAEALIRADFEQICGVSFIPVALTLEPFDGSGTDLLQVGYTRPHSVSAVTVDGFAFSAAEVADVVPYRRGYLIRAKMGCWHEGHGNVKVTMKHGYSTVPPAIKQVALTLLCATLIPSDIAAQARSYSDGTMTYQLGFPGQAPHWYGIDEVDAVLDRYRENGVVIV